MPRRARFADEIPVRRGITCPDRPLAHLLQKSVDVSPIQVPGTDCMPPGENARPALTSASQAINSPVEFWYPATGHARYAAGRLP